MTTNQNNAENTQQIAENKKCTLKNRCVNLLCIMSFGNETFQNTNDRYSKFENCTCLLTISALLNPSVPVQQKKRRFTGDHSWSNHYLCLFSSYEGEACHEKYDTKADANDAAVAARAWLRGHSPFPVIERYTRIKTFLRKSAQSSKTDTGMIINGGETN